jgi:hypothetical protein
MRTRHRKVGWGIAIGIAALIAMGRRVAADVPSTTAPAATALNYLSVPTAAEQARAARIIDSVFKDELGQTGTAARRKLAQLWLHQAVEPGQSPANQYVLLNRAVDLAAATADTVTAMDALDQLARRFGLLPHEVCLRQIAALAKAQLAAKAPTDYAAIANAACRAMQQTLLDDDFASGQQLAGITHGAVANTKNVALAATLQAKVDEYTLFATDYQRSQSATATLKVSPDDAAAHAVVGRYLALVKNDWPEALPHLAAGDDEALRAAAKVELTRPAEPIAQIYLADRWWETSNVYNGLEQAALRHHARQWYATARAGGLSLARTEQRMIDPSGDTPLAPVEALALDGLEKAINLLPLADPIKDAVAGTWQADSHGLHVGKAKNARLALPYEPGAEYDFIVEFTRTDGTGGITMLLHDAGASFGWTMGAKSSSECRFEVVNKRIDNGNPTLTHFVIDSNVRHIAVVQVRHDRITALIDGKKVAEYKDSVKLLTRYALWKLPDEKLLGVGANNSPVTFHSIEVREITGSGKLARTELAPAPADSK